MKPDGRLYHATATPNNSSDDASNVGIEFEIALFEKNDGPLTKAINLVNGKPTSDGSACLMARGWARREPLSGLDALARLIEEMPSNQAISLGQMCAGLPDNVEVVTARELRKLNGKQPPEVIARTLNHFEFPLGAPGLLLIDHDRGGMPHTVAERIAALGGVEGALMKVIPDLAHAGLLVRASTSAGLVNTETGEQYQASGGSHLYIVVEDAKDITRFLETLHERCWLADLGWGLVDRAGRFHERSIVDKTVGSPERLVFEGKPVVVSPLDQDLNERRPKVHPGPALDTHAACADLTAVDRDRYNRLVAQERERLKEEMAAKRAQFITARVTVTVEKKGVPLASARRLIERGIDGILTPTFTPDWDEPDMAAFTIGDVLANPETFIGATMADPIEGRRYGVCKAMVMRGDAGTLIIHSFAHCGMIYALKYDAAAVEDAMTKADQKAAVEVLAAMTPFADIDPASYDLLKRLASERSGLGVRVVERAIKNALATHRQQRTEAKRSRQLAERVDPRVCRPVPLPDDERLPVMSVLDEVLEAVTAPEPPMRNIDGRPVEVRVRMSSMLHELTSAGANAEEPENTRLPAPELPLLSQHDQYSLEHQIERHIEFFEQTNDGARSVALPQEFVNHYIAYRDSRLPRVGGVVTAPLVLPDGTLLALNGLDRARRLVFRIEPELVAMLPSPRYCDAHASAIALDYLTNDLLCDVATTFAGKCVLISFALSVLERFLLPERPAWFITAGKRGGGKTTVLIMLIIAVTGRKPAAAAWSKDPEERRKAMLAYLAEGIPALVWDNIEAGSLISCPTLEKVLTSDTYSDRVLQQSAQITVPTQTIMAFTGNNIGPKGDLASRSLIARLSVDRPDPENRPFRHPDPITWTLDHRGEILSCLYTLLLANPQLQPEHRKSAPTRFKPWWHLVGSALENAAAALVEQQSTSPPECRTAATVNFSQLFGDVESEDEETIVLAEVLDILHTKWPGTFQASQIADLISQPLEADVEIAETLRGYFEQGSRRGSDSVTAKTIGKRLSKILDGPVLVDGKTMKLKRCGRDRHGHAARFEVQMTQPP